MQNRHTSVTATVIIALTLVGGGTYTKAADPAPFNLETDATSMASQGQVSVRQGESSIVLSRSKADMEKQKTEAVLSSFPVREGLWDLGLALRSKLYSPDSSYNGTVRLELLNAGGKSLRKLEVAIITGDSPWKPFRKRVEIPSEAVSARFILTLEKSYGEFAVDKLRAAYAGPVLRTVRAIKFGSAAVGNLFLPDQPLRFEVTAECTRPRPESERAVNCVVRDYWGAEYTDPIRVGLTATGAVTNGRMSYRGTLDLSGRGLETGKYYEIHAEMSEAALPEPARDTSSFAILPLAVTKQYKPFDIPFTASGWNPGVPGFFPLCDRLGLRVANVYSRWSSKPPYESTAPGIEIVKGLGMGALMSTPVMSVEQNAASPYDETALREGARRMVEKYSKQLPIAIRVGNEPHPVDEADVKRMIKAYKAVYEGVKAADRSVIVTATSCGPDEPFFRNNYQPWHDVYDFHAYADHQSLMGSFTEYDQLVARYGQRKPVWTTEIGLNSEGMARGAVAGEMIKIFANFFAAGGVNASWFGIMWPDPDGSNVGSNGDSFDVFNSKYTLYSPKLTAVSEYTMVNGICIKKVVGQKSYPGAVTLTLFRDVESRCLLVAWKDNGREEVFLPLPGVGAVRAIRLDGGISHLDAGGKGLTLGLSSEPTVLEFTSADVSLPSQLGTPRAVLAGAIIPVTKGGVTQLALRCNDIGPDAVKVLAPPRWTVQRLAMAETGIVTFAVGAPGATAAREGRLLARVGTAGEILIPIPVEDPLKIRFLPRPVTKQGAGMGLDLLNRGKVPQQLRWSVTIAEVFPMNNGTFTLSDPQPFTPAFTTPSQGELTLAPGAGVDLAIRAGNLDPHSLYRARLEVVVEGKTVSEERLFGGCPGVPKVKGGVTFDGKLGDPSWRDAAVVTLDQPNQFAFLNRKTAAWDGPADLSGTMRLLWDDQYLYIGMKVCDDIFSQPKEDGSIWCGDGLQFLVDPCRAQNEKPGKYDYAVALTRKGPQAWCSFTADAVKVPSGAVKDFRMKITPTGEKGGLVYELAIPWQRFSPFIPVAGADLGLAMIINEDDGQIRDSFMSWFGCAHSKQMSMNGDLILIEGE